jgi:hypothetical protein
LLSLDEQKIPLTAKWSRFDFRALLKHPHNSYSICC